MCEVSLLTRGLAGPKTFCLSRAEGHELGMLTGGSVALLLHPFLFAGQFMFILADQVYFCVSGEGGLPPTNV
jgi:hypothetical protein